MPWPLLCWIVLFSAEFEWVSKLVFYAQSTSVVISGRWNLSEKANFHLMHLLWTIKFFYICLYLYLYSQHTLSFVSYKCYLVVEADIDEVLVSDFGELFDGSCVALAGIVCIHLAVFPPAATAPEIGPRYQVINTVVMYMNFQLCNVQLCWIYDNSCCLYSRVACFT